MTLLLGEESNQRKSQDVDWVSVSTATVQREKENMWNIVTDRWFLLLLLLVLFSCHQEMREIRIR